MTKLDAKLSVDSPYFQFLSAWANKELRFQRCHKCWAWTHPPAPYCSDCGSDEYSFEPAPQAASLFSFSVVHFPAPADGEQPRIAALIEFERLTDVRLYSTIVDATPEALELDMPLQLYWQASSDYGWTPLFKPKHNPGKN